MNGIKPFHLKRKMNRSINIELLDKELNNFISLFVLSKLFVK